MNYDSITDKPFINSVAGASVHLCEDCLATKYVNAPEMSGRVYCACEGCGELTQCQEIEKKRLTRIPGKKRKKSVMVQFNIFKKQVVVK